MKIVLANTMHYYGGGDSSYTFNLAQLLRFNRHEVSFFAMQDERNLKDCNSDLFVSNIDFNKLYMQMGIINGMKVLIRVIYSISARRKFAALLDRVTPDIIHIQSIHGHISPSIIYEAKKRRLPVIWTLHDYKMVCPNTHFIINGTGEICELCKSGGYYNAIVKRCKKESIIASIMAAIESYAHKTMKVRDKLDMFITPSAFLRSKLIEGGFLAEKVMHIPLFIPDEMFIDNGVRNDGYLLYMAKLDPIKGIYPLLNACRMLPNVKFKLAGRIADSLVKTLIPTLPANVEYLGLLHGSALRMLLLNAHAVILPSLWYENQPFTILESFAAGKPVIASDLGGMTELVKHGERGLLVPPGDVSKLAEAIRWITEHSNEAGTMGGNARRYALKVHKAEMHYDKLMNLYNKLIN